MSMVINPNRIALCVMLAGTNHQAGVLLYGMVHWIQYASATIPKVPGKWIANDHEFWRREAQLSRDQLSRNLKYLDDRGLIQRRQWWWGGSKILFVRPSPTTLEFLAAATTWPAADELVQEVENQPTDISKFASPGSATLLHCELSKTAQPTPADLLISNNIQTEHTTQHKVLTSGSSATPTHPGEKKIASKYAGSESENVSTAEFAQEASGDATEFVMSVADVTKSWITSVKANGPGHQELKLSAKQKGAIARIAQDLGQVSNSHETVGFQVHTADILDFGISHWTNWKSKSANPDPEAFYDSLEIIVNGWVKAGCPTCSVHTDIAN